ERLLPLVGDFQRRRHQALRYPVQTPEARVGRAMRQGEVRLNSNDGTRVVLGCRTVARSHEMHRKLTTVERALNSLLGLLHFLQRQLLLGQYAVAALPQLVAHKLALLRKIGGSLGEINKLRRSRNAVAVSLSGGQ